MCENMKKHDSGKVVVVKVRAHDKTSRKIGMSPCLLLHT